MRKNNRCLGDVEHIIHRFRRDVRQIDQHAETIHLANDFPAELGDAFMALWREEGIDTRAVGRDPDAHTGLYFISYGPDGHQFSYVRRGSAASRITVDDGARGALVDGNRSLLPAGITAVDGDFEADAAVEVVDEAGEPFAKGLVRLSSTEIGRVKGRRTGDLPDGLPHETIHRDDLVVLPS